MEQHIGATWIWISIPEIIKSADPVSLSLGCQQTFMRHGHNGGLYDKLVQVMWCVSLTPAILLWDQKRTRHNWQSGRTRLQTPTLHRCRWIHKGTLFSAAPNRHSTHASCPHRAFHIPLTCGRQCPFSCLENCSVGRMHSCTGMPPTCP